MRWLAAVVMVVVRPVEAQLLADGAGPDRAGRGSVEPVMVAVPASDRKYSPPPSPFTSLSVLAVLFEMVEFVIFVVPLKAA